MNNPSNPDSNTDEPVRGARELINRFLVAHPDGGSQEFEAWLIRQGSVAQALVVQARALLEAVLQARGLMLGAAPPKSFFRPNQARVSAVSQARASTESGSGFATGQRIGHFTLGRFIAAGGMGQVWEARDENLRSTVALKLVSPGRIDPRRIELFSREARAGGRLNHPNLVRTLAYGSDDGFTWIAQELIEGGWTLKDFIDDLRTGGHVPQEYYRHVADFVAQLASALQAAHDAGVIHRDVKPQNILIAPDDTPKLTDFGLARVSDDSFLSNSGDFAGTFAYMSPEQVTAKRMGLDHRTDIFSLGIVLYEMLALRRPFEGDTTHQIATQIVTHDPLTPTRLRSQCPDEMATIALKALEKDPGRRYPSMTAFAADLRRHLANQPILAKPPGPLVRASKWVRRNPSVSAAGLVGLVAIAVISWLLVGIKRIAQEAGENESLAIERADKLEWKSYLYDLQMAKAALDSNEPREARKRLDACPDKYRDTWEWKWLDARQDQSLVVMDHGEQNVFYAQFNSLGSLIVTQADDALGTVRLWSGREGEFLTQLEGHTGRVNSVRFHPDGTRLVTASNDQTARVWDPYSGQSRFEIQGKGPVLLATYDPSGTRLLLLTEIRKEPAVHELDIYDARTGELLIQLETPSQRIGKLGFSPDGSQIIAHCDSSWRYDQPSFAMVWDASTGEEQFRVDGRISAIAWNPDGTSIALGGGRSLRVIDSSSGNVIRGDLDPRQNPSLLAYSPDGTKLLGGGGGNAFEVYDTSSWSKLVGFPPDGRSGYTVINQAVFGEFDSGGDRVLCSLGGFEVSMWDVATWDHLLDLVGHTANVNSVCFSPDGTRALTASRDGTARLWETDLVGISKSKWNDPIVEGRVDYDRRRGIDLVQYATIELNLADEYGWRLKTWSLLSGLALASIGEPRVGFSVAGYDSLGRNSGPILSCNGDDIRELWDPFTLELVGSIVLDKGERIESSLGTNGPLCADGSRLLYATRRPEPLTGCVLQLWSSATGEEIASFEVPHESLGNFGTSPDGSLVAASPREYDLPNSVTCVWDADEQQLLFSLPGVWFIGFSADGKGLLTIERQESNGGRRVQLRDARSGELVIAMEPGPAWVTFAALSPDGTQLVAIDSEGAVHVWDAGTGRLLFALPSFWAEVSRVAYSPDNCRIVTASEDGTLRVWDARTGDLVVTLRGSSRPFERVSFSPDGERITAWDGSGNIQIWNSAPYRHRYARYKLERAADKKLQAAVNRRLSKGERPLAIRKSLIADGSLSLKQLHAGLAAVMAFEDRMFPAAIELILGKFEALDTPAQVADAIQKDTHMAPDLRALVLDMLERSKGAELDWIAWSLVDPDVGCGFEYNGSPSTALKLARAALALDRNSSYLCTESWTLFGTGQYDEALTVGAEAVSLSIGDETESYEGMLSDLRKKIERVRGANSGAPSEK